jgi:hypothetical protein
MKKEEASSTPTMGLQRLLSIQRNQQRRRRKILARNESAASANKQKGCSIPDLPEVCHINFEDGGLMLQAHFHHNGL